MFIFDSVIEKGYKVHGASWWKIAGLDVPSI